LTPDVETVQQIIFRGDLDIYTFTLDDLNRVLLQATGIYPVGACLEVISGINGPQIWTQSCVPARADVNLQPGTYYVLVTDGNNDATGNYKLLYQRLRPQDAVPLAADVPVVEQIDPVGDLDLYSFTLETSSRVVLQATSNTVSLTPCIQVKSSIGGPAGVTCGSPSAGVDVTLAAGKYFVLVYHQRWDRMGEYTLLYQRPGP
jgi:hypothetical protein